MSSETYRQRIEAAAKHLIVDATYSARGHHEDAKRWERINTYLGLPREIVSALLASGAALTAVAGADAWFTAVLALLAAGLTAVGSFFRPGELAEGHGLKGNRYTSLCNEARLFRYVDLYSDASDKELTIRLRDLRDRYNALNETAPRQISQGSYEKAKQSIARGESSYEDDPLWSELSR